MDMFMRAAYEEAKKGMREGGIPIGSVLVVDGKIVGRGHNRRVQRGSPILHAEMDAFESAGRLKASDYQRAVLYSTLSPCDMCTGATLLYKVPRVVEFVASLPKSATGKIQWRQLQEAENEKLTG